MSPISFDVVDRFAYKVSFKVNCQHFKGVLGRLSVQQKNEEITSKETLTVGENSLIIYPKITGKISLDFEFGRNVDLVSVGEIFFKKLEPVLALPDDLQDFEIFAAVASIPQREAALKDVVNSILPQVDRLFVYLNGYEYVPDFLCNSKIEYVLDPIGRTAASAKLYWLGKVSGYYFSVDDDIVYPSDYCRKTIEEYRKLDSPCMVSYHGKNYSIFGIHQRLDRLQFYQFENEQKDVCRAHVLGTGVAMVDTRLVKCDLYSAAFKHPRSIDLAVSIALRKSGIARYTLPKKEGWLKQNDKVNHGLNEFKQIDKNASKDVEDLMISGIPWVESRWLYKLLRLVLGLGILALSKLKNKKIKKLLRDPKRFFLDSKISFIKRKL